MRLLAQERDERHPCVRLSGLDRVPGATQHPRLHAGGDLVSKPNCIARANGIADHGSDRNPSIFRNINRQPKPDSNPTPHPTTDIGADRG